MYKHEKELLHPVSVERPNQVYAAMMQEQLGGPNGELKAGLQYISQSFRVQGPAIKDLFLDIGSEELSHMEMVAETINLLQGEDLGATRAEIGTVGRTSWEAYPRCCPTRPATRGSPPTSTSPATSSPTCSPTSPPNNRAKVVYEYVHRQIEDKGVREMIDFLLNREEAHNGLFREALNRMQDQGSSRDFGVTRDSKLYFDLSTPGRYF